MNLSRRTIAKVETWVDKQKTSKLRKLLVEGWVFEYEARVIEDMSDEDVRAMVLEDIKSGDEQVETVLETINIEPEYSDDEDIDDDDDLDESEEE